MQMSEADRIGAACSNGETVGTSNNVIVGEWSGAIDDCAYWLNGVGRGVCYTLSPMM
jgi:aryl-phospho-beta-D-glucosidase BglC (GH1 family)